MKYSIVNQELIIEFQGSALQVADCRLMNHINN